MKKSQGRVIWITGLSGAGKTTLARALLAFLSNAILLDGDELRKVLQMQRAGFDIQSRKNLALTYARLAALLANQGFTVVVATISLFHEVHAWNRKNMPGYMEIFLDVPEEVRLQRDPKGLYAAEKMGTIHQMAGKEISVEFPNKPHLRFGNDQSLDTCVERILAMLNQT